MQKKYAYIFLFGLLIFLLLLQTTPRYEHAQLFLYFGIATICYILIAKFSGSISLKKIILLAVVIRIPFLFFSPNLSDDYYRFIWDGHLTAHLQNPFKNVPSETDLSNIPEKQFLKEQVYRNQNDKFFKEGIGHYSKNNPTVYPLVNQIFFVIAASIGKDNLFLNVFILKTILFVFDILLIQLLIKILNWLKKPPELVKLYAFNPLVIIELLGNVHFEGATIYFMLLGIWYLHRNKKIAGFIYALGVGVKLIPLIALPLFFKRISTRKFILFLSLILGITLLMFLPFANVNLNSTFGDGIRLYFNKFEFNGSIYYLERFIGEKTVGFNAIQIIGIINSTIIFTLIVLIALFSKKRLLKQIFPYILFALSIFYLFSSIVHPWYIVYVLIFALLSGYYYGIAWSILTFISYYSYQQNDVIEPIWLTTFSYFIVFVIAIFELRSSKRHNLEWLIK